MADTVRLPRIPFTVTIYDYRTGDWTTDPIDFLGSRGSQERMFDALTEMHPDAGVFWDRDVGQLPEGTRTITIALWNPEDEHSEGHHGAVVCSDGMWTHLGCWNFHRDLRWVAVPTPGLSLPSLLLPPPISEQLPYPFAGGPATAGDPDPIDNEYDLT